MPISRAACQAEVRSSMSGLLLSGDHDEHAITRKDEGCRNAARRREPSEDRDHDRDSLEIEVIHPVVSVWIYWSGRRDSNPRPRAWEAPTLPTELRPLDAEEKPGFAIDRGARGGLEIAGRSLPWGNSRLGWRSVAISVAWDFPSARPGARAQAGRPAPPDPSTHASSDTPLIRPSATFSPRRGEKGLTGRASQSPLPACGERARVRGVSFLSTTVSAPFSDLGMTFLRRGAPGRNADPEATKEKRSSVIGALCGYAAMRLCGYAAMRLCGYAAMELCGYGALRLCSRPAARKPANA
jgi:hypothetical protein